MPFLTLENVVKTFGALRAVDGVSLSIGKGEVFSLLGPSGCGKTTLLRLLGGFELPDQGRVLLNERDITSLPPHRRPVNTVFQNYALFPHLSVRENIAFGPRSTGRKDLLQQVDQLIAMVKLEDHALKKPGQLSGGQKQRVAIARALINQPEVLLLDEPLAALDLKLRQHMLTELQALHRQVCSTFIFVTHDQTEAIGLSDRIAIMNHGRVEQVGTPREIYDSPQTGFVASFIGDTNFISARVLACQPHGAGDIWQCRLDAGVLGPLWARSMQQLAEEAQVRISVRPEDWLLSASAAESNAIEGRVQEILYLGASTRAIIEANGQRLVVLHSNRKGQLMDDLRRGVVVWLSFHPEDAVILPENSQACA